MHMMLTIPHQTQRLQKNLKTYYITWILYDTLRFCSFSEHLDLRKLPSTESAGPPYQQNFICWRAIIDCGRKLIPAETLSDKTVISHHPLDNYYSPSIGRFSNKMQQQLQLVIVCMQFRQQKALLNKAAKEHNVITAYFVAKVRRYLVN